MSAIFPTAPAKINLHHLPSNADFISYETRENLLWLKAWMPAGLKKMKIHTSKYRQYDTFYNNNCSNCERNSGEFYRENYEEYFSDTYFLEWTDRESQEELFAKECCVYFRGFCGQECNAGHTFTLNPENNEIDIQNMVFEIGLTYLGDPPRFKKSSDNAHLGAGYFDESTGEVYATASYSAPNVYGGHRLAYYSGNICWGNAGQRGGSQTRPDCLRNISTLYFGAGSNNDLLRLDMFQQYNETLKEDIKANNFTRSYDKFLCSGYDSLMLIDADKDVQAFFTMLMAGFKPIPEAPHVMIVPLKNCTIEREGNFYFGYSTQEDSVGRCWYVSSEGYLIGQLDPSYSFV